MTFLRNRHRHSATMRKLIKILLPVLIVVIGVVLARALIASRPGLENRESSAALPLVSTVTASHGPVTISVESQARVEARHSLQLSSEVAGRISWMSDAFTTGALLAPGAALLRVDDAAYKLARDQARLTVADAKLALAEEYARLGIRAGTAAAERAAKENQRVMRALAQIAAADSQLQKAEQDLQRTRITAPEAVLVNRRHVAPGQFINVGTVVAELFSVDTVELRLPVSLEQLQVLGDVIGKPVDIRGSAARERLHWRGEAVRIEQHVDAQTHLSHVVAAVKQPYAAPQPLRIGQFVRATISNIRIDDAVRLPREALYNGDSVFIVDQDNRLRRRLVAVNWRSRDDVVVGTGIDDGDRVVINRLDLMVDGMQVRAEAAE